MPKTAQNVENAAVNFITFLNGLRIIILLWPSSCPKQHRMWKMLLWILSLFSVDCHQCLSNRFCFVKTHFHWIFESCLSFIAFKLLSTQTKSRNCWNKHDQNEVPWHWHAFAMAYFIVTPGTKQTLANASANARLGSIKKDMLSHPGEFDFIQFHPNLAFLI